MDCHGDGYLLHAASGLSQSKHWTLVVRRDWCLVGKRVCYGSRGPVGLSAVLIEREGESRKLNWRFTQHDKSGIEGG
jgi:hypothetical protein